MSLDHYPYIPLQGGRIKQCIQDTVEALAPKIHDFDVIAIRGNSGAIVGGAVAAELEKSLLLVRKPTENSHGSPVETSLRLDTYRYVVVDDFVSSGETIYQIHFTAMKSGLIFIPSGIFEYKDNKWNTAADHLKIINRRKSFYETTED